VPLTPEQIAQTHAAVESSESFTAAAASLGIDRKTLRARLKRYATPKPFEAAELPSSRLPLDELLEARRRVFARKQQASDARRLIPVTVTIDGPIGIAHFGDPHVDDDGANLPKLERHLRIVNKTEGLFAGNVGDYQNNWIGRLARLWAQQSTSASQSWQLVEWLIGACDWLYLVGGNHDAWSGDGDPIQWISSQAGALFEPHAARLELRLPSKRLIRINARHDFKGRSIWNTAHGPSRAAQTGWRDHILTCGHTHVSGYAVLRDPMSLMISHALRISSYKQYDRHAVEQGFPDQDIFCCPVTIIDPRFGDDDPRCISTVFDPEEGADFLTWKRKKWARGSKAS
jgi:hypothetical protein